VLPQTLTGWCFWFREAELPTGFLCICPFIDQPWFFGVGFVYRLLVDGA
jgi:hypothetical protein